MKFILALLTLTFALGAFACDGSKDKDEEKRLDTTVRNMH